LLAGWRGHTMICKSRETMGNRPPPSSSHPRAVEGEEEEAVAEEEECGGEG
jgi:hypothetical protein